jgi:phosphate:Na+ symporter
MNSIATALFAFLGGIGAFLLGVKILSDNLERLANNRLKQLFDKTSKNRFFGVGIGLLVTAIVQSSGLTTVMVVGFVNAGMLSLFQATAIIMGANIGTTITAQIAALQSFNISDIAICLLGIGVFAAMLSKKEKVKNFGYVLAGLGLVFMGLAYMTNSMEIFKSSTNIEGILQQINSPVLLLILGIVITALFQSSSAVTSVLIAMVSAGLVIGKGGNAVLFVILGSNIGSCVTALLSSIGASNNAKRASMIHLLFNVFGSLIFFIILVIFPNFMEHTFNQWFTHPATRIAMFHTFFNVVCTCLFLPFINVFVFLSKKIIRDKTSEKETGPALEQRLLATPSIAIAQVQDKIVWMMKKSMENLDLSLNGFAKKNDSFNATVLANNEQLNVDSKEVIRYLVQISSKNTSLEEENRISTLHDNLNDVMRISELADNMTKYTYREITENLIFSPIVYDKIDEMQQKLHRIADLTVDILEKKQKEKLKELDQVESEVDEMRNTLIRDHINRLNHGECRAENSSVYINLVSNLERAADHLTYIAHSLSEF